MNLRQSGFPLNTCNLGISDGQNLAPDSDNSSDDAVPHKSSEPSAVEKAFEFLFKDDDSSGTLTI